MVLSITAVLDFKELKVEKTKKSFVDDDEDDDDKEEDTKKFLYASS
jgi:hypothetical protein